MVLHIRAIGRARGVGRRAVATLAVSLLVFVLPAGARGQEQARFRSLAEALESSTTLRGGSGPSDVNWIDGGRRFSYTALGPDGQEIRSFDPTRVHDTLVFSLSGRTFPGSAEPFAYKSFQWSADSRHLVFQTDFRPLYRRSGVANYYVYSLDDGSLTLGARDARTAQLSPDGKMLGYERDGDMFVYDMAGQRETRLTSDASETVYNGHFDWVYEEEFGEAQAWHWSPDSRFIAFWQVDESAEPVQQFTDYAGRHPDWWKVRIPQPGDSNATVKIGVVDVATGRRVWLDPGEHGEYYVPRVYWVNCPDTLALVTLNRPQTEMNVYFFDVTTGGKRLVLTQRSDAWIDLYDFYARVNDMLSFPAGIDEFFWISDRDGWQHIYRYDYTGKLLNQVTHGQWSVTRIEGVDPKTHTVYYTSTEASPLQRQMYAVRFDGTNQRRITSSAGTHHINMAPDTRYYIDSWSSLATPTQVELWGTTRGGKKLGTFETNATVSRWLASHVYSRPEILSFTTSDGAHLDASMIRPVPFDSTHRYPVVFDIYGGPGSQQVYDAFSTSTWDQWLAQQGYLVIGVNNRASNNYGSAFMKISYRHLGKWESHDFAETARYLAKLPYVDAKRVGIIGTSYGGYSTVYTMEMYPELFTVGVANSPVTDWRLYDTIYTERYMGLLGDNGEGYEESSAVKHADRLTGHLLLIHSMLDDNVHIANTMQLLTALTKAGHDADLRLYPPGRHGAAYSDESRLLIREATFEHLQRYLKGEK
jgi:dipeptidyl-peptidase-4